MEGEKRNQRGFTLVELLFATFILSIVISAVYGSYRATFHIIHNTENQLELDSSARTILDRFSDDLLSIVTGPGGLLLGETTMVSGSRGDTISFISSNHLRLSKKESNKGRAFIKYHTAQDNESGTLNFYRTDTLVLPGVEASDDENRSYLLGEGLHEIHISYVGREGRLSDEWNSAEIDSSEGKQESDKDDDVPTIPQRIEITLFYGDDKEGEQLVVFRTAVVLPKIIKEEQ